MHIVCVQGMKIETGDDLAAAFAEVRIGRCFEIFVLTVCDTLHEYFVLCA
jgi:hypothetical protein